MSTRLISRNLFPPLDNPELTIRRRSRSDPTLLNNSEMAAEGPGDLPVPDLQTMEELCQPSLNGRGGPIAPIAIQATNFRLKNDVIQQVQNSCQFHGLPGDDANKHLDKFLHVTRSIKVNGVTDEALRLYLFPHSLTHHATAWFDQMKLPIFRQRPDESLFEAWECYKLSIDRCPNHNMFPVTQIDTYYNGLTLKHRDTINAAAGGTFMKRPQRSESSSSINSSFDTKITALKAEMAEINKNHMRVLQVNQQVKAVTPNCETCGGPHSFSDCPAIVGNTQNVYAARAYQGNTITNPKEDLKGITTRRGTAYPGPMIPTTSSSPSESPILNSEPVVSIIIEHVASPVSAPRPNLRPLIPYPSRLHDQKLCDKANDQREKFFQIFKDLNFNISFADALILMLKFGPSIKSLLTNKDKLCELARTLLNEHCLAVLLKKLPEKLRDPGKFLIPCDFPVMAECLALVDLDASINLMPFSMWNKFSLPDFSPTCMNLELADHSISRSVGVAEDVFVKVGTFHFPTDFVVVDFDADTRVPLILERSFLKTGRALIDVFEGKLTIRVGKEAIIFNLDQTSRYSANYKDMTANRINVIDMACEEYLQEVFVISFLKKLMKFLALEDDPTSSEVDQSYLDSEGDILLLEAFLNDDPSLPPPNQGNYQPEVCKELKICEAKSDKSSIDEPPEVELKDLPPYLEYTFLEGDDKLPVIIAKDLSIEEKTALITVLKSYKRAITWKLSDIMGINPEFCTHKIVIEEDFEPAVQHQRRVNPKIHDVIKQEVLKLLNAGLIYPISDSPWDSSVHYQEKTTFTCPYGTFACRCMSLGICNAPGTFQRCMMAIFYDMIEKTMKVFTDDFLVFGNSFQSCLSHLEKMLKRCEDTNLCLNWEKSHFMVKEGIVLGHKISKEGIEVEKAKLDVITKLPHPTTVKGIRSFLGHAGFYRRFIEDFSKIARPMTRLLKKDTPFIFFKEYVEAFQTLKRKLTEAPILIAPDWDMSFELMCDASDFAIESNYTTTKKEMLVVVYAFKKFRSYLIMNKSIVYMDHSALKYLFAKKYSKARLLRWVLLLREFTFKVIDIKGAENLADDHLSRLENPHQNVLDPKEINESFPLETLNLVSTGGKSSTPWFADFANYHVGNFVVNGVYTARKPLTFSRLATMDPPGDTMAQITQPRRYSWILKTHAKGFCPPVFISLASLGNHTAKEKKTRKIDHLARSLLIQGLPNDIFSLIDSNKTAKDLWDALERQMRGSEYGEQDRKAAILYEYETFKGTKGEQLLDTYLRYLQGINDLKKCGYKKDNWEVNDTLVYKKKAVVVTSDPLALVAEKTKVSNHKEKVKVQTESEGSDDEDISDLKNITALLAKAFNRKKYYAKPTNYNLRTSSASSSVNKKPEYVNSVEKKEDNKADEKKRDNSKVKCYNCKKEGHFTKDCKKAKEINANTVFMAQIEKVLSDSDKSSSSAEETIAEVAYYTSESKNEYEFETLEYYDNFTNYGLFVNNDDDQEIFHDAIESASENFIENHIDSQKDYDKSEVDHNDSEEKEHLVDKLIWKFNPKIAKCQKRIEKANQQSRDLENRNKDLQEKYDVLINQVNTFEEQNNEFNEQIKVLNKKNDDLLAQTEVLQDQLKVKHVLIDTHTECQAQYAKLEEERYEYMIRYSDLCDNDKQHRKKIDEQEILFKNMSRQLVEMNNNVLRLQEKILEKETKNFIIERVYSDTFSSVRRPKQSSVIWKKKISSNTSNVDLSYVSHSKLNKDVKRYSRKDLLSCCVIRLMRIISPVRKMPFRKKPRDSMNAHSKSNSNKSLPRTVHRWLPKMQQLAEPVAKWIPRVELVVDDYSRYTWVFFLHYKDEVSEVIISFINKNQVNLQLQVQCIRTNNGTEYKNKTLAKFFDEVGITQQFSAARTPQQNGVVERRNRTLVEAARTMLTFANLPLFLWAEAIVTACFIQNHLIIHKRFDKTPYELMNKRKPNVKFFRVFGCRCYLLNDYEDVGKLKAKGDIGVFVGYSKESATFRIFNKRTRKIHEIVNVNFDEISEMASKQFNLEDLFHNFYDEYFDASKIMKSSTTYVEYSNVEVPSHEEEEESSSSSLNDDVQQSSEKVGVPSLNTQPISNNMVPNVDEA
nr:reverse transcriptase domain-containing protein [Tanacetum cinerariifolium]